MVKLRNIVTGERSVQGLTCPDDIAMFFSGCRFTVEKSGTAIVYYSGANQMPTPEEINEYRFEDCIIGSVTPNGRNRI